MKPSGARRRIVAYVEGYDDVMFWRNVLTRFENDKLYFEVMLPSRTSLAKGKKVAITNILGNTLGRNMIACVDADYDYLLQGARETSRTICQNPYVFHTYAYAIENFQCYAESLHEVCVMATLNDRPVLDLSAYMRRFSQIAYPLFLWNVWFYRQRDTETFPMHEFNACTRLSDVNLKKPYLCLDEMRETVEAKLAELRELYPEQVPQVKALGKELADLGLKPDTTYLYMQGHHIMDGVVMKLLTPICTLLRREREQEIRRLAEHNEQFRNELTGYENSQTNVQLMLRKNSNYKDLFLYQWVREDIRRFLDGEPGKGRK